MGQKDGHPNDIDRRVTRVQVMSQAMSRRRGGRQAQTWTETDVNRDGESDSPRRGHTVSCRNHYLKKHGKC